jgi:hypothetical protein
MYYDIKQMLIDTYERLNYRAALTQLLTDAAPALHSIHQQITDFISRAQISVNSISIYALNNSDPELADKLNHYAKVTIVDLLADPILADNAFSNQHYGNLCFVASNGQLYGQSFSSLLLKLRSDIIGALSLLNIALSHNDYTTAISKVAAIKVSVFQFANNYILVHAYVLNVIDSITNIVVRHTIVQIIFIFAQLIVTILATPVSAVMWLLSLSQLSFLPTVVGNILALFLTVSILLPFLLLSRLIYGAAIYEYLSSYSNHSYFSSYSNHSYLTSDQSDAIKYIDVFYLNDYMRW